MVPTTSSYFASVRATEETSQCLLRVREQGSLTSSHWTTTKPPCHAEVLLELCVAWSALTSESEELPQVEKVSWTPQTLEIDGLVPLSWTLSLFSGGVFGEGIQTPRMSCSFCLSLSIYLSIDLSICRYINRSTDRSIWSSLTPSQLDTPAPPGLLSNILTSRVLKTGQIRRTTN